MVCQDYIPAGVRGQGGGRAGSDDRVVPGL